MSRPGDKRPEAPLDLVVVADFAPAEGSASPLARRPTRVDKATLPEVMAAAAPTVLLDAPGVRAEGTAPVRLSLGDLRAFRPEALAAALPAARSVLELKAQLEQLHRGETTRDRVLEALDGTQAPPDLIAAVRRALTGPGTAGAGTAGAGTAEPAPRPEPSPAPTGDALFDLVDVSGSNPEAPAVERSLGALDRLVREIVGSGTALNTEGYRTLAAPIDDAVSESIRVVLHHPGFVRAEAAWRGLRFLAGALDFRAGVRLHALSAPAEGTLAALTGLVAPLARESREEGRTPVVILGTTLGADPGSLAGAAEIARWAETERVPVVTGFDAAALLGIDSITRVQSLDNVADTLAAGDNAAWEALRSEPAARWLSLAANRFLLRAPYGRDHDRVKGFAFEENPEEADPRYLWGSPAWFVGALVGASFARNGWGAGIVGPEASDEFDDLPVRPLALRNTDVVQIPLEMLLPENRVLELSQAGITALACARNRDRAFLASAPGAFRPPHRESPEGRREEARRASFPFTLFAAQVTGLLEHLLHWMDTSGGPESVAAHLATGLEVLTMTREGAVLSASGRAAGDFLHLEITPAAGPVRGLPPLVLDIPVKG